MPRTALAGCCLLLLAGLCAGQPGADTEPDPQAAELRKVGIEPNRQGLESFLESLRWTPAREARVRALLADLGSDRFRTREKATAELLALPPVPRPLLEEAARKDPETRRRVERILEESRSAEHDAKVLLVLRAIEEKRIRGLAPLLLELMPQWPDYYLNQAAARTVELTAQPADGPVLRRALADGRFGSARAAAVAALASVFGHDVEGELEARLADADPRVALASATALLNQGNRKPLPVLVQLLEAESGEVRRAAADILRAVSGADLASPGNDDPDQRARAVAAWRDWVGREGATAQLQLPVRLSPVWRGRVVLAVYGERLVREVDLATGKTVFEVGGFGYPWGCHATPEGHRLAVDYAGSFVVEYDGQGKECWRHNVAGRPTGIERLPNGRTLVALPEPGVVVELDRAGKVAWEVSLAGRPTTAQRLANGNTLVSLQTGQKVVEIDTRGTVVWQVAGLQAPHTAQRLPNGNVLVCEMGNPGGVVEYDRAGKVVWSRRQITNPAQAQRLPSGNTLVSADDGLIEFDPQGNRVRHIRVARSRFFAY